jgi:DNA invertase Pin-like site-specific DNA recombinase
MDSQQVTPIKRPKAYSYLRFSTAEQAKGDSFERQFKLSKNYADLHGLELDQKLTFHDLGKSAFDGENLVHDVGKLAHFLECVKFDLIAKGSYLLVESLDRISRQGARKSIRILEDIVDGGINLVTLTDGKLYNTSNLDSDPFSLIFAILIFIRANEESQIKSTRLTSAWSNKRNQAVESLKPLTAKCPGWLRLNKKTNKYEVIPERGKLIKDIYRMALEESMGHQKIANKITSDGIKPWGKGKYWQKSYIAKILKNFQVIGVHTTYSQTNINGKIVKIKQNIIDNYFPAVVDYEDFFLVQTINQNRLSTTSYSQQNMLASLAKCHICGATMTRKNPGNSKKSGKPVLVCTTAKNGKGCVYKTVNQEKIETFIVKYIDHILHNMPSVDLKIEARARVLSIDIQRLTNSIDNLTKALSDEYSPSVMATLRQAEASRDALKKELDDVNIIIYDSSDMVLEKRKEDVSLFFQNYTDDKTAANIALRKLLSAVVIDLEHEKLDFHWKNGQVSYEFFSAYESFQKLGNELSTI